MKTSSIIIRVSPEEKAQFRAEAKKGGVSLSLWIICNLIEACEGSDPLKPNSTIDPVKAIERVNVPKRILCMRPMCDSYETDRYPGNGRDLYLCIDHQPK